MMTERETSDESNRAPRKALLTKAVLLKDEHEFATVKVRNLSRQGLGGEASEPLKSGDSFAIELRGIGKVSGTVAWAEGVRFGMRFDNEINLETLQMASPAEVKLSQTYTTPRSFEPASDYKRPGFHSRKDS